MKTKENLRIFLVCILLIITAVYSFGIIYDPSSPHDTIIMAWMNFIPISIGGITVIRTLT